VRLVFSWHWAAVFFTLRWVARVWFLFDANVAKPIDILSGASGAHADVTSERDASMARYLGDLAPAAPAAARRNPRYAGPVRRETQRVSDEKLRLNRLLSDVPVAVLRCSSDHTLAFYNSRASDLMAAGTARGLDRQLFDDLREGPVRHAHDRLIATGDADAATDLLCTAMAGARVMSARMRLTPGAQAVQDLAHRQDVAMQDSWQLVQTRASDLAGNGLSVVSVPQLCGRPARQISMVLSCSHREKCAV